MKRLISIITFLILMITFIGNSYATYIEGEEVELDPKVDMNINVDKTTVKPSENVTLTVQFGKPLGTYTVKVAYDKNIFEYVSVDGGTANVLDDKVNVVFHDETGGKSPRTTMSITFKAKENITTSNPTELTVTAEGLANADASETYEDILVPAVKNITVEPKYEEYKIKLERPENIIKGKEAEMTITYSSAMGHYYEHARLVAEVTTPKGATVKLLGTDTKNVEYDLVQSGWGDPQGYKIGGKDVEQILKVRGLFSDVGNYAITLTLIDRDNSDKAIASGTFLVNVTEETTPAPVNPTPVGSVNNTVTNTNNTIANTNTTKKEPTKLPKTGTNVYIPVGIVVIALVGVYAYYNRKED